MTQISYGKKEYWKKRINVTNWLVFYVSSGILCYNHKMISYQIHLYNIKHRNILSITKKLNYFEFILISESSIKTIIIKSS